MKAPADAGAAAALPTTVSNSSTGRKLMDGFQNLERLLKQLREVGAEHIGLLGHEDLVGLGDQVFKGDDPVHVFCLLARLSNAESSRGVIGFPLIGHFERERAWQW